mmetsp:Transcript_95115/g.268701  ORF Transcript_95115/g.268701 Transcript_95115/m.268701 type:complete len:207 (-) Transcript_95115:300-920(-)
MPTTTSYSAVLGSAWGTACERPAACTRRRRVSTQLPVGEPLTTRLTPMRNPARRSLAWPKGLPRAIQSRNISCPPKTRRTIKRRPLAINRSPPHQLVTGPCSLRPLATPSSNPRLPATASNLPALTNSVMSTRPLTPMLAARSRKTSEPSGSRSPSTCRQPWPSMGRQTTSEWQSRDSTTSSRGSRFSRRGSSSQVACAISSSAWG